MSFTSARPKCTVACLLACIFTAAAARAAELKVPDDFRTIQEAIDEAATGDVIVIEDGIYTENLVLVSDIELRGQETARTILQAENTLMQLSGLSGVTIRNLTFNAGDIGIELIGSLDIEIVNNVFAGNGTAISVDSGSDARIRHNTFHDNGVAIDRSTNDPIIENNIFSANDISVTDDAGETNIAFNCFATGDGLIGDSPEDGDPRYVDVDELDFHLREDSDCIDAGDESDSDDVFDGSDPDAGAYGGPLADTVPFPVGQPEATVSESATDGMFNVTLSWQRNLSYLTETLDEPYKIYYDSDETGPPYEGTDAQDAEGNATASPVEVGDVDTYTLFNLLSDAAAPDAPELEAAEPSNRTLDLRWSAVDGATGYRIEYGVDSATENRVDVGAGVTSHELTGLENGVTYRVRVSALQQARYFFALVALGKSGNNGSTTESERSPERSVAIGPARVGEPSNELRATAGVITPHPRLPDQGDTSCFIATAAYGHFSHPQVQLLRDFRDRHLLTNPPGRAFVRWYYRHSPAAAGFIAGHEGLKMLVRGALLPVIAVAWLIMHASALILALLPVLCVMILLALAARTGRRPATQTSGEPRP